MKKKLRDIINESLLYNTKDVIRKNKILISKRTQAQIQYGSGPKPYVVWSPHHGKIAGPFATSDEARQAKDNHNKKQSKT